MVNKQPEVTELTKTKLRRAFWSLYEHEPIEKISIKQITDIAGYNRGTFYLYFKDVYDLREDIERKLLEVIGAMAADIIASGREPDLSSMMDSLAPAVQTYGHYLRVLLGDNGDPLFKTRFKELTWPFVKQNALKGRSFSPQEERLVKECYLAGLVAIIGAWLNEDDPLPVDRFIAFTMREVFG